MSASQLPQILVEDLWKSGGSLCGGLHDGAEGNSHACTLVHMMIIAHQLDVSPPTHFSFGMKSPKEAAPPELAE